MPLTSDLLATNSAQTEYGSALASAHAPGRTLWDVDWALQQDPDVYQTIRRDPETLHAIQARKHLVAGRRWRLEPASDRAEDRRAAELVEELLGKVQGFAAARFNLAEAVLRGAAWARVLGHRRRARIGGADAVWWVPERLVDVDKRRFVQRALPRAPGAPPRVEWQMFALATRSWVPLTDDQRRWLVRHAYNDTEDSLRFGRGLTEAIYYYQYAKTIALREGLSGLERWAQGFLVGKVGTLRKASATRTADTAASSLLTVLENFRSRHMAVVDDVDDVKLVDGPTQGHQIVKDFLAYLASGIRVLLLGSNLPTSATEGGSYALAQVQENSTENLVAYDRELLGETLTRELVALAWAANRPLFGALGLGAAEPPRFLVVSEQRRDPLVSAQVAEILLRVGFPLREDELAEATGFSPAGPHDRRLEPPAPLPAPTGGGLDLGR